MKRIGLLALALASCTLPKYEKVSEGAFSCPGLSLPSQYGAACQECVARQCCDSARDCGNDATCASAFGTPITPFADLPESFDATLGCMQDECDAECNVSFACEGTNYLEPVATNAEGAYDFPIRLRDFASLLGYTDQPVPGVRLAPCAGLTASCMGALGEEAALTSDAGVAELSSGGATSFRFQLFDPDYDASDEGSIVRYPPQIVHWSIPVHERGEISDFVFSGLSVKGLVEMAAMRDYSPADSHIVFYMHNCLPLRLLEGTSPRAGVKGALVTLTTRDGRESASPIFREGEDFLPLDEVMTGSQGSGGAAQVSPGAWIAEGSVQVGDTVHKLSSPFQVPAGGVGIVHVFPRMR